MLPYSRPRPLHALGAQLAATEIVRRCERRVGELVKQGQEEGTVKTVRDGGPNTLVNAVTKVLTEDIFGNTGERSAANAFADADDFDAAIEVPMAEGNLSGRTWSAR